MRTFGYIGSGILVGGSLLIATSAIAGGFGIREQSTTGLGNAFSDSAAGSDLSSMYWNPAAVTSQDGLNSLSSFTAIIPDTDITPTAGIGINKDDLGLLGASYYNYQVNQQLYVGLSLNSPLGLVTTADPEVWAGEEYFTKSEMLTFNATPTIGYKITPELSVAAGVQIQYMKVRLATAINVDVDPGPGVTIFNTDKVTKGDDVAVGFTLGMLYKSDASGTSVGVGYRSAIQHKLDGSLNIVGLKFLDATVDFEAPQMATASIRQQITPDLAFMASYEWTDWSSLKEFVVIDKSKGTPAGGEQFNWSDSWFASVGAEMKLSEKFTGRAGLAYEKSPVPLSTRTPGLPDSDRIWLSFGGSYQWSEATMIDFGYSHIFFKDADIALSATGKANLNADVDSRADIVSVGMRMKW